MEQIDLNDTLGSNRAANLPLVPDPDEVSKTRWVDLDALVAETLRYLGRFTPSLRIYLAKHRDITFGPPHLWPAQCPAQHHPPTRPVASRG
ncbi:isopentenyldiphosphate isomerase [Rhodobacteraceae bacterium MBR-64]|jgi:isopentenyl-diphosphate delta-isomerase